MTTKPEIEPALKNLKTYTTSRFGKNIRQIIVYGSHARNEMHSESDIDILIVIAENLRPFEVRKQLSDVILDILLQHNLVISVLVVTETMYQTYNSPLFLNVKAEGIVI